MQQIFKHFCFQVCGGTTNVQLKILTFFLGGTVV